MTVRVAFFGLGNMGLPMARHLASGGVQVDAWDPEPSHVRALLESHPLAAVEGERAGVAECDYAFLMLPTSAVVESVLTQSPGLFSLLTPGSTIIDMSSSDPASTARLAAEAATLGIGYIDAPVTGGVRKAIDGTLSVMCGCNTRDVLSRARPLLALLGSSIIDVGAAGAGHAAKALNNLVSATALLSTAEALLVGSKYGIAPERLLEVLNGGSGRNSASEVKYPNFILPGSFDSGFAASLMGKDVDLALGLADAVEINPQVGRAVGSLWRELAAELPPNADHTEIVRPLAQAESRAFRPAPGVA